jgi:hypothetical protein
MDLPPGLLHVLAQTRLYTDGREYVVVSVPLEMFYEGTALLAKMAEPFSVAVVDKDELTLVFPMEVWEAVREHLPERLEAAGYRLITFDLPLDLGLVGYLATLTDVVAEAGVSMLAFSAYQRDHLLVPEGDFDRAWKALDEFIARCREREQGNG